MKYDCVVIGSGISGLTAASLLAKRGLTVAVCEQASSPGGSCGIFKRYLNGTPVVFDQGASMLYGFGTEGFNAHRFLFNCLEESFYVIKHDKLCDMYNKVITEGSWYPAGSTLFLPGILEKVIEENNGKMYYDSYVEKILFNDAKASGVLLSYGTAIAADNIIYSGTIGDLYGKLLPETLLTKDLLDWVYSQEPTYPCLVFYGVVEGSVIPEDCCAIELLTSDPGILDENEITVYIPSLDDHTICDENHHVIIAIGPSFINWGVDIDFKTYDSTPDERYANTYSDEYYNYQKKKESERIINILEKRFSGISEHMIYHELATPFTIQRYTMKTGRAAAGPKQMLDQHMMKRKSIKTDWQGLFCCGESTTMGTGTSTVTVSGIAAANAVLKRYDMKPYVWKQNIKNHVIELDKPVTADWVYKYFPDNIADIMKESMKCIYCENPTCCNKEIIDIPGIMRRASCGNIIGAYKKVSESFIAPTKQLAKNCIYEADPSKVIEMIFETMDKSL